MLMCIDKYSESAKVKQRSSEGLLSQLFGTSMNTLCDFEVKLVLAQLNEILRFFCWNKHLEW